jgi:hypothetical protein
MATGIGMLGMPIGGIIGIWVGAAVFMCGFLREVSI